jgi:hypothetical protein
MHTRNWTFIIALFLVSLSGPLFLHTLAFASFGGTLFVANTGSDSAACGTSESPCRSISQAIANAAIGSEIVVGPGTYGDIDGDGVFSPGSGDEAPSGGAMIAVTKPLSVISSSGSASTMIRFASGGGAASVAVAISAAAVRFGQQDMGFSVIGNGPNCNVGIRVLGPDSIIEGNIVTRCFRGVEATGSGVVLAHNRALANAEVGFVTRSDGAVVTENSAASNGFTGFVTESLSWQMSENASIGNDGDGATIDGNGTFVRNAMIGNARTGLGVNGFLVAGIVHLTISSNSFYANLALGGNCGMFNNTFTVLDARGNFWGAPTGPGPDPADQICGNPIEATPALMSPVSDADLFGLLVQGVSPIPIVLDFEGLTAMPPQSGRPIPPQARLSDAFLATHGVRFSSGSPYVAVVDLGPGHATSGVNGIGGSTATGILTYDRMNPIVASFFDPNNPSSRAVTNFVSVRGDLIGTGQSITLKAFDVNGRLIASATGDDTGGATLAVTSPGIHSVQFLGTQDFGGVALDDFTFNPVTPFPDLVHGIGGVGFPSGITGWSDDWQIIVTGDEDTGPAPTHYVLARPYGQGRVLALGHESMLTLGGLAAFDNSRFITNVIGWLDKANTRTVLFTTGHDEGISGVNIDGLRSLLPNHSFDPVSAPLTPSQLSPNAVLIIGHAKADFTVGEIEAIRQFVESGGSLLLAAQGWAWVPYYNRPLDEFPMNRIGEPFKIRWLGANLRDPTNETAGEEVIYHIFYPDPRTLRQMGVINDLVNFTPDNYRTTSDTAGCPSGFAAKFLFDALLVLKNGTQPVSSLDIKVTELSNGNLVQNAFGGPAGVGATLTVPFQTGYADGIFAGGKEYVVVPCAICLKSLEPFRFFVDVLGRLEDAP